MQEKITVIIIYEKKVEKWMYSIIFQIFHSSFEDVTADLRVNKKFKVTILISNHASALLREAPSNLQILNSIDIKLIIFQTKNM